MESHRFDLEVFFGCVARSGARALLIGRQALIALGLPVSTNDYDLWIHIDDIDSLNTALEPLGLHPNRSAGEARKRGRYVLENDESVDVLVSRSVPTTDGVKVVFDDVWADRQSLPLPGGGRVEMPALEDLIKTKQFGSRPKDAEDVRLLRALRDKRRSDGS